jgi:hypothetical protein
LRPGAEIAACWARHAAIGGRTQPRTAAGHRCRAACAGLYEICTPQADFGTRPVRATTHHVAMDVVAIVIAVAFFAAMLLLIKAIDRI